VPVAGGAVRPEGEHVHELRLRDQPREVLAEIVRVAEDVAAAALRDFVERILVLPQAHRGALVPGIRLRSDAADVHRVDDAVGAVEELADLRELLPQRGRAEALVRVHLPDLAVQEVLPLLLALGRADEEPAAEAFGEIDDVLPPLDRVERLRELAERLEEMAHAPARVLVVPHAMHDREGLEALGQARPVRAASHGTRRRKSRRPCAGGLRVGERERVGPLLERVEPERLDRARELDAIGRERDEDLHAPFDRVGRDRREIAVGHPRQDEVVRGAARVHDRLRTREREVEEEKETAPRRGRQGSRGGIRLFREVDRVEPHDRLRPAVVLDGEVRRGQAADRLAVAADDADRHLDERDLGRFTDRRRVLRGRGRGEDAGQKDPRRGRTGSHRRPREAHYAPPGIRQGSVLSRSLMSLASGPSGASSSAFRRSALASAFCFSCILLRPR
jgi:hypothetical protein